MNNKAACTPTAPLPTEIHGLAALTRPIFLSQDYSTTVDALYKRVEADNCDAAALLDLGTLHQLLQLKTEGLQIQRDALRFARHFPVAGSSNNDAMQLLVLLQPGTFQENTPIEFLVEQANIRLELLFLLPEESLPERLPEHDVLLVGIGYSESSVDLLTRMIPWLANHAKPIINRPETILKTSREALKRELEGVESIFVAGIARLNRAEVLGLGTQPEQLSRYLKGAVFPVLVRPVDSHAGLHLEKIDEAAQLSGYLESAEGEAFFVTEFVDYRNPDGLFRKSRVVLIGGKPYIAHLAMNDHWMIHYLNAGMRDDPAKRAMEAQGMESFHADFAKRHAQAFAEMHKRLGLDYLVMDCSETPDGKLFVFEADNIMIVHDMDPEDIYPYKKPAMQKLFAAFAGFLLKLSPAPKEV